MNILLDEGVPRIIQQQLAKFSISTVEEMGWRAVENGALLDLMAATFQTLITTDKNILHQQNFKKRFYRGLRKHYRPSALAKS